MLIEGVIVCVDFSDYLAETIVYTQKVLDRIVIVTSTKDSSTISLCKRLSIRHIISDRYKEDGGFNKGKAINDGLSTFKYKPGKRTWRCCLDADIVLPPDLKTYLGQSFKQLRSLSVKKGDVVRGVYNTIFGAQRLMCTDPKEWDDHRAGGNPAWTIDKYRTPGNPPPGFLQIWSSVQRVRYPEDYRTASKSDIVFSRQFPFSYYIEPPVIHLENSSKNPKRLDHLGRASKKWRE